MGVNAEIEFPVIEFRSSDLERGTDGWYRLCKRVREACETFGCFEVAYEKISTKTRKETFGLMKELIEQHSPYHGDTNRGAYQLMIIDSYGLEEKWESMMINYKTLVWFMKYMAPPPGEYERGLFAHTDKPVSTIICDDQVSGLEIEVSDGKWIKLSLSPSSFCFVVGDPLKAWSNGRLKAMNHRVMMTFAIPIEGTIIKAPKELIDKQHPQLYKDFDFMDFFLFAFSDLAKHINSGEQLQAFASLSLPISN
ncbi:hypothetical protein CXB51_036490 [Gossypium anomalum]|uniref:Isopenicillin N synthase-like Fe(2+) 2OG dioxygenase domain-containing protein n=1 Tax=Gossypium anomalum TaxID=47600 RepID=A0A8J6CL16_9ROSI|nr:hypothetical protein CXB51_036490 [Gossypium anomalum]